MQNKLSAALQNTSDYKLENAKTDAAISEAETEYAMNGELHNARSAFAFLKRKYFNHTYNIQYFVIDLFYILCYYKFVIEFCAVPERKAHAV